MFTRIRLAFAILSGRSVAYRVDAPRLTLRGRPGGVVECHITTA